jgi:hypothetical protein
MAAFLRLYWQSSNMLRWIVRVLIGITILIILMIGAAM